MLNDPNINSPANVDAAVISKIYFLKKYLDTIKITLF